MVAVELAGLEIRSRVCLSGARTNLAMMYPLGDVTDSLSDWCTELRLGHPNSLRWLAIWEFCSTILSRYWMSFFTASIPEKSFEVNFSWWLSPRIQFE